MDDIINTYAIDIHMCVRLGKMVLFVKCEFISK